MKRIGKQFEFGWPYISKGLVYDWPNLKIARLIEDSDKEEVRNFLLEKLKTYINEFDIFTNVPPYPYLQVGIGFALHLGDGGRWISFSEQMLGFASLHNLDVWSEKISGFNICSDLLEYFDKSFLAPRISSEKDGCVIRYPLPDGEKLLNVDSNELFFKREGLEKVFKYEGIEKIKRNYSNTKQEISCDKGEIIIKDGMCEAREFKNWDICKITFPIAKLLDASFLF